GSAADIPAAELITLSAVSWVGRRVVIKSQHLAGVIFVDERADSDVIRYTIEQIPGASAQAHTRTLRLMRAAIDAGVVVVRSLPEDEPLLLLPLGDMVRRLDQQMLSHDTLRWCETLARLERILGRTLSPDTQWTESDIVLIEKLDEF